MAGRLYVISGPSGVGKSTIIRRVMKGVDNLGYSVSHTTRKPRGNEVDGKEYHFVTRETFMKMIRDGDLLEWAEVYGDLYGTSFSSLRVRTGQGTDLVLDVDPQGALNIRKSFGDCVLVFILPPSLDVLEKRLRDRGTDSEDALRGRIAEALREIQECLRYDYLVFNVDLSQAVETVKSIILSERCRTACLAQKVRETFPVS
ncbi:MAG: guanylate kinase [Thermodesulfobacteriota bacterium]